MKQRFYLVLAGLFLLTFQLRAQIPNSLNYQGVARDANGNTLPNQSISLRFTIHQATTTGVSVYQETWSVNTNDFGLFTVSVGSGTVVSGNFSTITWGNSNYFLQVEMDPTGGTNYIDMGTNQFLSVPYALYAASAGNSGTTYKAGNGISITGSIISADSSAALWNANKLQGDSISITTPSAGQVLQWNGAAWVPTVQTVLTDTTLTGNGTATSKLGIAQDGATTGQVLEWNGVAWAPTTVSTGGNNGWALIGNTGTTAGTNFIGTTDANDLVFKTNGIENMRIDNNNGYIGIGTSSPGEPLHVVETDNANSDFGGYNFPVEIESQNGTNAGLYINGSSSNNSLAGIVQRGNSTAFYEGLDNTSDFRIAGVAGIDANDLTAAKDGSAGLTVLESNGNVGIGTSSPAQALDVEGGNLRFAQALMPDGDAGTAGYVLQSNGPNVAPTWVTPTGAGTPTLTQYQIAFGDASNLMTSSPELTYNGNQVGVIGTSYWGIINIQPSISGQESSIGFYNSVGSFDSSWVVGINDGGLSNGGFGIYSTQYGGNVISVPNPVSGAISFNNAYTFPTSDGAVGQVLTTDGSGNVAWQTPSGGAANAWNLIGNAGTTYGTNFIGTTDDEGLMLQVNGNVAGRIEDGNSTAGSNFNNAIGYNAMVIDNGTNNEAFGAGALGNNSGSYNVAMGDNAMGTNTGNNNQAVGASALNNNSGTYNVAMGDHSMLTNTGNYNVGIGGVIMTNNQGDANVAVGFNAMESNQTGTRNAAIGYQSLQSNTTGTDNTAIGNEALTHNLGDYENTAVGSNALASLDQDNNGGIAVGNTAVGTLALGNLFDGNVNTAIGYGANFQNNDIGNPAVGVTLVGAYASVNNNFGAINNATAIGVGAMADSSNSVVLGNNYVTQTDFNGALGIWTGTNYNQGAIGQVLQSNGPNVPPTWVTPSLGGTVTSVGTGFGLAGGPITTTGIISIDTSRLSGIGIPTIYFVDSSIAAAIVAIAQPNQQLVYGTGAGISSSNNLIYNGNQVALIGNTDFGVIQVQPATPGQEASIGFWNTAGDNSNAFVVGINEGGLTGGGFSIFSSIQAKLNGPASGNIIAIPDATTGAIQFNNAYTFPTTDGTSGQVLSTDGVGNVTWATSATPAPAWDLTGNNGTVYGTDFIGTTDDQGLEFKINNSVSGRIEDVTTGNGSTAFGYQTLETVSLPDSLNTAFGFHALNSASGNANLAIGAYALRGSAGSYNTAVGAGSEASRVNANVTGNYNTGLGSYSLWSIYNGNHNTAAGYQAEKKLENGNDNAAFGTNALGNSNGSFNTGLGDSTLVSDLTGTYNTAVGFHANVTTDGLTNSTVIGNGATVSTSNTMVLGNNNVTELDFNGSLTPWNGSSYDPGTSGEVLQSNGSGTAPTWVIPTNAASVAWTLTGNSGTTYGTNYIGTNDNTNLMFKIDKSEAGRIENATTANTALGYNALLNLGNGIENTGVGVYSLYSDVDGSNNTALGYESGFNAEDNGNPSGEITLIGAQALLNNIPGAINNATVIGYSAEGDSSNSVVLGNHFVTQIDFNGALGIWNGANYNQGEAGQVLQSNGLDVAPTWVTAATGSVASVGSGFGIKGGAITTAGTLSIDTSRNAGVGWIFHSN